MINDFLIKTKEEVQTDESGRVILNSELAKKIMIAVKEKDVSLVLDKSDLMISFGEGMPNSETYDDEAFKTLDDIVAAHITSMPPVDDTIQTKESTGLMNNMLFVDPSTGIKHIVPYPVSNDTIHFTLNCTVHNHQYGNDWDSYKYGVLIDFKKLNKEKVLDVKSEDTYIDGDVELGNEYLLFCPLGEREDLAKKNPNAIIAEYDGVSLKDAMSCMIVISGRKLEPYGTYGWGRNTEYGHEVADVSKLEELVVKEGYPVLKGQFGNALHSETKYMARRMWKREYEALIRLMEYNKENGIEMPDDVVFLTMEYGGVYGIPGTVPVTLEDYKEVVVPILQHHGYDVDDSLLENIEEDSQMKIIHHPPENNGFPVIYCPKWEETLRTRVIDTLSKGNMKHTADDINGKKI